MTDRLEKLQAFLKDSPSDPFLNYAIATEYLKLGNTQKALEIFTQLTITHPNYVGTYYHLGKLQERLDMEQQALQTYTKGMDVAMQLKDLHSHSELQGAYNMLNDELNY